MSEQRLKDFAEAAEQRVPVPDLVDLTSRGQDLRRIRMAAAAGALALVTVAGGVLACFLQLPAGAQFQAPWLVLLLPIHAALAFPARRA